MRGSVTIHLLQLLVLLTWAVAATCFVWDGGELARAGRLLFWVLLAVHTVEAVVVIGLLRRAKGSLAGHLLRVLLFGVLHVAQVRAELASASGTGEADA